LCIAYITRKLRVTLKDAYGLVKDAKSNIRPNDGFVQQLKEYYNLLHEHDHQPIEQPKECHDIKPAKNEEHVGAQSKDEAVQVSSLQPSEPEQNRDTIVAEGEQERESQGSFHCKKCRLLLFKTADVTAHLQGNGQTSFSWHKRTSVR
jgi:hypothetical protein